MNLACFEVNAKFTTMNTILPLFSTTKTFTYVWVFLLILTFSSCAKKITFPTSMVVPAANGYIKIKSTKNNYSIDLVLRNLAKAKNLMPPRETYIVWAETNDGIKKLGEMNSSGRLFSKSLKATLGATLAHKPKKVFITAEDDRDVLYPGMQVVLQTEPFRIR